MNAKECKQTKAATTIQKHVRGLLARKKYGIRHLTPQEETRSPTFVVGNDPAMPSGLMRFQEADKKIALIATSGIRAVSLACKLGNMENTPKIILVDNSVLVYKFWYALREFMSNPEQAETSKLFLKHFPTFLDDHKNLFRKVPDNELTVGNSPTVTYLNQNIMIHFNTLFRTFGYDYVRAIILHASIIKQSWADPDVFLKIKNVLHYQGIQKTFMYPSNIVASIIDTSVQTQVLENIKNFAPLVSIHTDYCQIHGHPEKVFVFKNQAPDLVKQSIFSYKYTEQCYRDMEPSGHGNKSIKAQS